MPVSSCIMNYKDISDFDFRKRAVDCKLIIVFAEGRLRRIYGQAAIFLRARYMVIGSVHARTHQVCHTGVINIVLVGMLECSPGNQVSVGTCNHATAFHEDFKWMKPVSCDSSLLHLCNGFVRDRLFFGSVRMPMPPAQAYNGSLC